MKVNSMSNQLLSSHKSDKTVKSKNLNFKQVMGLINKHEAEKYINE